MHDLDEKYKLFQLDEGLQEHLVSLSDYQFPLHQTSKRIVVETLVVENGERRILHREERDA